MASAYSKLKIRKMINQDWSAQATIKDCYNSTQLIQSAAASANILSPFIHLCGSLYREANDSSLGEEDMIAVIKLLTKSSS
jgi:3-hydroxyisobutyrate dehydrogenase-like beta-hydroxyacid dehydrogenase